MHDAEEGRRGRSLGGRKRRAEGAEMSLEAGGRSVCRLELGQMGVEGPGYDSYCT